MASCGSGCWYFVRWFVLVHVCFQFGAWSVWDWTWERSTTCQAPALPANQTGLKVLLYGPMKTGTKSLIKALHQVGLPMAYHSEEFLFNVWTGFADEFWRRPENGGAPFATIWPPANKATGAHWTDSELQVLQNTTPEELAAAISRCRVDALAFDGIEKLFYPTLAVSPGAKVISLNWRTWEQWLKSKEEFEFQVGIALYLLFLVGSSMHLLPYSVVVIPLLEYYSDGAIHKFLSTGSPPFTAEGSFPVTWFRSQAVHRRWISPVLGGLQKTPENASDYYAGFEAIKKTVPPENLFEWDMKKHTLADLCAFLGVDTPACKTPGTLPKGINILYIEREQWDITLKTIPCYLLMHWINWKLVGKAWLVLTWPIWKFVGGRPKTD